jgi:hypothetical protein
MATPTPIWREIARQDSPEALRTAIFCVSTSRRGRPQFPTFCSRVSQARLHAFLYQRSLKFCHRAYDLEHQPPRRGAQVQIVAKADKCDTVSIQIGEGIDEEL